MVWVAYAQKIIDARKAKKLLHSKGRAKPYTASGIRRMQCSRIGCNNRATQQWRICSDGNKYRPICKSCDIEINKLILEFMGFSDITKKIEKYKEHLSE